MLVALASTLTTSPPSPFTAAAPPPRSAIGGSGGGGGGYAGAGAGDRGDALDAGSGGEPASVAMPGGGAERATVGTPFAVTGSCARGGGGAYASHAARAPRSSERRAGRAGDSIEHVAVEPGDTPAHARRLVESGGEPQARRRRRETAKPRPTTSAEIAPTSAGADLPGAALQPTEASASPTQPLASQWPEAL